MGKAKGKFSYQGKGWWQKGKGKGKGDKGKFYTKGKGKGDGKTETRTCHWCQKPGHLKAQCRSYLSGKPKVPAPRPAGSLEQPDWEEDLVALGDDDLEPCFPLQDDDDDDDEDEEDYLEVSEEDHGGDAHEDTAWTI